MTITELLEKLQILHNQHGTLPLLAMCESGTPITMVHVREAEYSEFPGDWNMPEGYTFISLE